MTRIVGVEPAIHISVCLDFPGAIYKLSGAEILSTVETLFFFYYDY